MSEQLKFKSINQLLGEHFFIPYYQRGYRWTSQQVSDLLNDIWTFANKHRTKEIEFYCLQPIVVKAKTWEEAGKTKNGWEVVDGQQRLTTIYIILSYLAKEFLKVESLVEDYGKDIFSIRYQTRPNSEIFLKSITNDRSNIDFYHMAEAYNTVRDWFKSGEYVKDRSDRDKFLRTILGKIDDESSVQIIWYEVDKSANSLDLFTRLNIGKIPLTNAELIKALFLSSSSFQNENDAVRKKLEISLLWDEMEQKLSEPDIWAFATNENQSSYSNKIELLFNMISGKRSNEIDTLYTFIHFFNRLKTGNDSLWNLWLQIEKYYQTLYEWFKQKNLYHKIGYLIAIGEDLRKLIEASLNSKKDVFEHHLDTLIRKSMNFDITSLSYEKNGDYKKIERVLLLFNVESIRTNDSITEFYPFKFHKATNWSLEHIHAQNSEGLDKNKKEPWLLWLSYHRDLIQEVLEETVDSVKLITMNALIAEIDSLDQERITWEKFSSLSDRIAKLFSDEQNGLHEDVHSISNLALIGQAYNSALNNSVFEVKRRAIIKMDREGKYIPICTRRVFLKYYNPKPSTEHYYFWGYEDRKNYINEIIRILRRSDFLPHNIEMEV